MKDFTMTDPMDDELSMEAILHHIRQQYEEERLQEQGGEPALQVAKTQPWQPH
jgi:hypothetical protein